MRNTLPCEIHCCNLLQSIGLMLDDCFFNSHKLLIYLLLLKLSPIVTVCLMYLSVQKIFKTSRLITSEPHGHDVACTRAYLSNEMKILLSTGKNDKTSTCRCNLMCSSSISRCADQMFPFPVIFLDRERGRCSACPAGSRTRLENHIAGTVSSRGVSVLVSVGVRVC